MSSSPQFPTAMCKGAGGKVLTASFISDSRPQEKRQGPRGISLNCLSKKKGGEREENVFTCWTGHWKDDSRNTPFFKSFFS